MLKGVIYIIQQTIRWLRGLEKIKDNDEDNIITDSKGRKVRLHDEGPEYLD